jgi:DNA-binding CsgD family transcriptional regulator
MTPRKSYQRRGPSDRPLSEHQLAALRLVAAGNSQRRVGEQLGIDGKSVGKLLTEVFRKLGAVSSPNAVFLACEAGLLGHHRPERHGDHAGFRRHERAGEDPRVCESCAAGERAYRAQRRAARNSMNGAIR